MNKVGIENSNGNEKREVQMDTDTLIIMGLLAMALCWWFAIHVKEERQAIKQGHRDRKEKQERAERVKRISNK